MELRPLAIEHGTSRHARWLRTRRLRLALWIAVAEGILVVADIVPGWIALGVAAGVIAFYLFYGREARSDTVRQASWIGAASQVCVALVPALVLVVGALALVAVVVLAVIALLVLFADRR